MAETHNSFNEIIESISPKHNSQAHEAIVNPIIATVISHAFGIDEQVVQTLSRFADNEVREKPFRSMAVATGAALALGASLAYRWRIKQTFRNRYS